MKTPAWLFSMDSDQFEAPPTTTGALVACYKKYGARYSDYAFELTHFQNLQDIAVWKQLWTERHHQTAIKAVRAGQKPIIAFSFYTWNAAPFLELLAFLKSTCPNLLAIAGGPHVQQAEDYLGEDPLDIVVLGEGEFTFCELLDAETPFSKTIPGIAFLNDEGNIVRTEKRKRTIELDDLPSPFDIVPLSDENGNPLYTSISYETTRGCPFTCAFCEWGTGAIGTKMLQFSLERIRKDLTHIVDSGIRDIWFADSNFGALKEDLEKTRILVELKQKTGLPSSFATSWSKNHSPKVQEIVRLLHHNKLLPHYQLALQTLTPEALRLSNRQNMQANRFEPIARQLSAEGIPIAAELIWGLPGDNLADFSKNLDYLLATFPNINIFGYTLLPGTEFYEKRDIYEIEAIPVAGYGKALGEYVVACHSFNREEGYAGYYLISAHILFVHGHLLALTTRYIALEARFSISNFLVYMLDALINSRKAHFNDGDFEDGIRVYENRNALYLHLLEDADPTFSLIRQSARLFLKQQNLPEKNIENILKVIQLDLLLCPRVDKQTLYENCDFDGEAIVEALSSMQLPDPAAFEHKETQLVIEHSGGVGSFLQDADGGSWIKGQLINSGPQPASEQNLITSSSL